tara:strand:+ start:300172 stop:300282 length:111 start_codon:yes stop_codon:yes gene_type:complete
MVGQRLEKVRERQQGMNEAAAKQLQAKAAEKGRKNG